MCVTFAVRGFHRHEELYVPGCHKTGVYRSGRAGAILSRAEVGLVSSQAVKPSRVRAKAELLWFTMYRYEQWFTMSPCSWGVSSAAGFRDVFFLLSFERTRPAASCKHEAALPHLPLYQQVWMLLCSIPGTHGIRNASQSTYYCCRHLTAVAPAQPAPTFALGIIRVLRLQLLT